MGALHACRSPRPARRGDPRWGPGPMTGPLPSLEEPEGMFCPQCSEPLRLTGFCGLCGWREERFMQAYSDPKRESDPHALAAHKDGPFGTKCCHCATGQDHSESPTSAERWTAGFLMDHLMLGLRELHSAYPKDGLTVTAASAVESAIRTFLESKLGPVYHVNESGGDYAS